MTNKSSGLKIITCDLDANWNLAFGNGIVQCEKEDELSFENALKRARSASRIVRSDYFWFVYWTDRHHKRTSFEVKGVKTKDEDFECFLRRVYDVTTSDDGIGLNGEQLELFI